MPYGLELPGKQEAQCIIHRGEGPVARSQEVAGHGRHDTYIYIYVCGCMQDGSIIDHKGTHSYEEAGRLVDLLQCRTVYMIKCHKACFILVQSSTSFCLKQLFPFFGGKETAPPAAVSVSVEADPVPVPLPKKSRVRSDSLLLHSS